MSNLAFTVTGLDTWQGVMVYPLIPVQGNRGMQIPDFRISLVYTVSSMPIGATEYNTVYNNGS